MSKGSTGMKLLVDTNCQALLQQNYVVLSIISVAIKCTETNFTEADVDHNAFSYFPSYHFLDQNWACRYQINNCDK